jgi:hypothetical protein
MPIRNRLIQPSHTFAFLILCCKSHPDQNDISALSAFLNSEHFHFPTLIEVVNQHAVAPLVYKTINTYLANNKSKSTAQESLQIELKSIYTYIAHKNIMMSAELIHIMKVFEVHDIQALAFKGAALSQKAYGDITLRQFGDLDILIPHTAISKTITLLTSDGYLPQLKLESKTQDKLISALNVLSFYKKDKEILLEVHWELFSKNYAIKWDEASLWQQKSESVLINTHPIRILPHKEEILYLCVHGSKHLFERLEWICDIDRAVTTHEALDWEQLLSKAQKRGTKRMLFLGLGLCEQFFGLTLPHIIQDEMKKDETLTKLIFKIMEINFSSQTQKTKSYRTFGLLWSMRERFSDRLQYALHALFSPKFEDFSFIHLPKPLLFLYPIIRPFRLVFKYFRA